jgi:hypothetical protein
MYDNIGNVTTSLDGVLSNRTINGFGLLGSVSHVGITHLFTTLGCRSQASPCSHHLSITGTAAGTNIIIDLNNGVSNAITIGEQRSGVDWLQSSISIISSPTSSVGCVGSLTINGNGDHTQRPFISLVVTPSMISGVAASNVSVEVPLCALDITASPFDDIIRIAGIGASTSIHAADGDDDITIGADVNTDKYSLSLNGDSGADYYTIFASSTINCTVTILDNDHNNDVNVYGSTSTTRYEFTSGMVRMSGDTAGANQWSHRRDIKYSSAIGTLMVHGSSGDDTFMFEDMTARVAMVYGDNGHDRFGSFVYSFQSALMSCYWIDAYVFLVM